jgi:hypothetical protein
MRSFVPKVIEAGRSGDFLTATQQRNSMSSGNNPADFCEGEPEFRGETLGINLRSSDHDLVFFPGVRGLQGGYIVYVRNSIHVDLYTYPARGGNVAQIRDKSI